MDPGVALGYRRRKLHPPPVQAVAGDFVRSRIVDLWSRARYVVLTHMHGDHVPLPNPNPFQLGIGHLPRNDSVTVVIPCAQWASPRARLRLESIVNAFKDRVARVEPGSRIGLVQVLGPYRHGVAESAVYPVFVDSNEPLLHLSDTELLVEEVVSDVRRLRPSIVVTSGPPIYRYAHDRSVVSSMLAKARRILEAIARYSDKVVVDHHLLRCVEGYSWLKEVRRELSGVTTAAEYMGRKPLFLEAWRSALYIAFPVGNEWFKHSYREVIDAFKPVYSEVLRRIECLEDLSEERFLELLKDIRSSLEAPRLFRGS
ncbi:MAG: hypothetical protein GXO32_03675 [Crenarchaeota archaeon]|nr:hypothetical protein [Thermoproteota archaeon]